MKTTNRINIPSKLLINCGVGLLATMTLYSGKAQAINLVLDSFDESVGGFQFVSTDPDSGFPTEDQNGPNPETDVVGQYRELILFDVMNSNPPNVGDSLVFADMGSSSLSWNNGDGVSSKLRVVWDGVNESFTNGINTTGLRTNNGGVGRDFTLMGALDSIGLELISADQGLQITVNIYTDNNSASTLSKTFNAISGSPTKTFYNFANFTTLAGFSGGANFANVGAFELILSGPTAVDASITFVEAAVDPNPPIPEIPEPDLAKGLLAFSLLSGLLAVTKR
ncbi:hypothetical protein [Crocosphaera sp. XPORK-15E]|uniref:hypothetical protein n=1 Tax=Crocosphaera sp. XPORK-15E TaxID=3110247 RepID=UPI002B1E9DB4|nr:hypothetical protein [Crocosphaera sp. XPORK-15E]MEA5533823.1 hypothetical protein [Crocosphaera sp. XPORK-15E]